MKKTSYIVQVFPIKICKSKFSLSCTSYMLKYGRKQVRKCFPMFGLMMFLLLNTVDVIEIIFVYYLTFSGMWIN